MLPFGSTLAGGEGVRNPLVFSPVLRRFDTDGDGDFDLQDVKNILTKAKCKGTTQKGDKCKQYPLKGTEFCKTHTPKK